MPESITTEEQLDDFLATPSRPLIEMVRRLPGDIMILGVGGKVGPTLGAMAVRAAQQARAPKQVFGADTFPDAGVRQQMERLGVLPITCDLLDPAAVASLPQAANVIFMVGRKFGTAQDPELTWAVNTLIPAYAAAHFAASRIVAFSTGCVYPLAAAASGGCSEDDAPAPVGEYAQSCLGRERVFQYFSVARGTPVCLIRLNYAIDLRYGVLHDIARRVWAGEPVDLTVPCFNAIWQGDAAERALLALEHCASPARVLNVTGPETISVRWLSREFGRIMGRPVVYCGEEGPVAYLSNVARAGALFGPPRVPLAKMIQWTAQWVMAGGRSYDKPTHFEVSTGKF